MKTFLAIACSLGLGLFIAPVTVKADDCAPARPTEIYFNIGTTTASFGWNEYTSGDDCNTGTPTTWEVWKGNEPLTSSNLRYTLSTSATLIASGNCFHMGDQCVEISNLSCSTTYYFALFLIDEAGNASPPVIRTGTTLNCGSTQETACE